MPRSVIPILITAPFADNDAGYTDKEAFMRRLIRHMNDSPICRDELWFYQRYQFYPLDPRDCEESSHENDNNRKARQQRFDYYGCDPVALPIQQSLTPHQLFSLIQQEISLVPAYNLEGLDARQDKENKCDWYNRLQRTRPRYRVPNAPPYPEDSPQYARQSLEWEDFCDWVIIADTTKLAAGAILPVLLVQCDILAAVDIHMGVESDELDGILACHRCASQVFGRTADWCRTHGLQTVRIDARLTDNVIDTTEQLGLNFDSYAAHAEDTYRRTDGIYTDDTSPHISEDELENKASKLGIGDQH